MAQKAKRTYATVKDEPRERTVPILIEIPESIVGELDREGKRQQRRRKQQAEFVIIQRYTLPQVERTNAAA